MVVVIIAALAAIAVALFLNQREKAEEGRLASDVTAMGRIVTLAHSTGSPLFYSTDDLDPGGGGDAPVLTTLYTTSDSAAGGQSVAVQGTITSDAPSGAVPQEGECLTLASGSRSQTYCVGAGLVSGSGGGGGVPGGSPEEPFIPAEPIASGGDAVYYKGRWYHTFTSNGTLTAPPEGLEDIQYVLVGGGGGGGPRSASFAVGSGGAGNDKQRDISRSRWTGRRCFHTYFGTRI